MKRQSVRKMTSNGEMKLPFRIFKNNVGYSNVANLAILVKQDIILITDIEP